MAKASSEIHMKLLKKIGADHVVFPEHEMGQALAQSLTRPNILDRFELDPDNTIAEVIVPKEFDGKTIEELKLRGRYGISVLALSYHEKFDVNPSPSSFLKQGMMMVVVGTNRGLDQLPI